jgi:RimJ/RimL family protein N-acetyltransferase
MIYEVQQPASHVLALDCPFPEAQAVIQGNNPGWVFVDDLDAPRTALVWAQGIEGFYLAGDTDNTGFLEALDDYVDHVLKPRLHSLGGTWFEVSGGGNWDPVIESTFEKRNLESSPQWVYTLPPIEHGAAIKPETVADCRLLRLDRRLLLDFSAGNEEFLHARLALSWGTGDAFLKAGLGYVLVCGQEIASLCCSAFVSGDTHALHVETRASHRRKGYAEAAARAFIAACMERQVHPYWDCMAENVASARLAEKLGFARSHTYTLYSFPLGA